MKILCVVDGWFPSAGGSEKQAILIAENMVKRGHEVDFLCPQLDANAKKHDTVNGIACRRLGFLRFKGIASATYCLNAIWFLLTAGRQYDVIHIHMVEKFALAVALCRPFLRARVLAKVAGATEFDGGVFDTRRAGLFSRIARHLTLKIGTFQAISRDTQSRLTALGLSEDRMLVLPNAIDLDKYTPSRALHAEQEPSSTVIAFTGRLVSEKALPDLVAAMNRVRDMGITDCSLRLAGDGSMRPQLEAQVAELDLSEQVHFAGEIDDVQGFLSQAHVYCQVSSIEGLSNSVLEAMASALPCVLTRISGNEDLLVEGRNGFGVEVGNVEAIAMKIATLVGDRETCRSLGTTARELVQASYGVERVVGAIERCYAGEPTLVIQESC